MLYLFCYLSCSGPKTRYRIADSAYIANSDTRLLCLRCYITKITRWNSHVTYSAYKPYLPVFAFFQPLYAVPPALKSELPALIFPAVAALLPLILSACACACRRLEEFTPLRIVW
uniref:Uncharacterized protein n=1 Tax=Podoviridae sp. ctYFd1 TaxID=2826560 RepID=A0A8S5R0V5_9CAUD|nr:MAG TPA: hypothetical protein [Podoviridae sp. ctYFd1]